MAKSFTTVDYIPRTRRKTPYFSGDVEPVRSGAYRVVKRLGPCWAHWNGREWSHGCVRDRAPEPAYFEDDNRLTAHPVLKWRGLAGEPNT